jgi:molybdopterin synthase catalytic subunit
MGLAGYTRLAMAIHMTGNLDTNEILLFVAVTSSGRIDKFCNGQFGFDANHFESP